MRHDRIESTIGRESWGRRITSNLPLLVIAPSVIASFIYGLVFTLWTAYLSLSNSSLLPTYGFVGLENYASLWSNWRWNIAYTNLFLFSGFYIAGSMAVGLLLAILIDQWVRGERSGAPYFSTHWPCPSS